MTLEHHALDLDAARPAPRPDRRTIRPPQPRITQQQTER